MIPRGGSEDVVLEPEQRLSVVLGAIRGAREQLAISFFRCDERRVLDELARAVSRGVRVEALLTRRVKGWEGHMRDFGRLLERLKVEVHWYASQTVKYHAKYLVVDDGPALIASSNFTRECFTRTCDFLLTTDDPPVVSALKALFESDCKGAGALTRPAASSGRLIVGPGDARRRMTALLEQARRSICLVDPKVTDPAILRLLNAKRDEGVDVHVLGADAFLCRRAHGRLMLIDGAVAVIGSISLSPPALDRRRELSIATTDPGSVACLDEFVRTASRRGVMWESTSPIARGGPARLPVTAGFPAAVAGALGMA